MSKSTKRSQFNPEQYNPEGNHAAFTPYREDLAYIHDAGFSTFASNAGAGVLKLFETHGIDSGLVVDLGCGSGVWARMLVEAGYDVQGIDLSPAMIEICRRRVPAGRFEVASLLDAALPACRAVTSMGECLNYLFDPQNNQDALRRLFRRIYEALAPGGLFICDVIEPGYGAISGPARRHMKGENWAVLVEVRENERDRTLTRAITSFRAVPASPKHGTLYRRDEETHSVQLYRGEDLAEDLRNTGFSVDHSRSYPDFELSAAHSVLVAKKVPVNL